MGEKLATVNRWGNRLDLPSWGLATLIAVGFLIAGVHGHRAHFIAVFVATFGAVRVLVRGMYLWAKRSRAPRQPPAP